MRLNSSARRRSFFFYFILFSFISLARAFSPCIPGRSLIRALKARAVPACYDTRARARACVTHNLTMEFLCRCGDQCRRFRRRRRGWRAGLLNFLSSAGRHDVYPRTAGRSLWASDWLRETEKLIVKRSVVYSHLNERNFRAAAPLESASTFCLAGAVMR